MMKIYQNVLVVNFLLTLFIDVEVVCVICTGSVLKIPMSKRKVSVHSICVKNALRRNPLSITIQMTLNLFLVEGKRIAVAEKKFSIHSPKLPLCVMINHYIMMSSIWYTRH
jgi:hypothetical protein